MDWPFNRCIRHDHRLDQANILGAQLLRLDILATQGDQLGLTDQGLKRRRIAFQDQDIVPRETLDAGWCEETPPAADDRHYRDLVLAQLLDRAHLLADKLRRGRYLGFRDIGLDMEQRLGVS